MAHIASLCLSAANATFVRPCPLDEAKDSIQVSMKHVSVACLLHWKCLEHDYQVLLAVFRRARYT